MERRIICKDKANIGVQGDNNTVCIAFPIVAEFLELYGEGAFAGAVTRPGDDYSYPVPVNVNGDYVEWVITLAETEHSGYGLFQIIYTVANGVKHTRKYKTFVSDGMVPAGEAPEPIKRYIDIIVEAGATATTKAEEAKQYAEDAERAAQSIGGVVETVQEYKEQAREGAESASQSAQSAAASKNAAETAAETAQREAGSIRGQLAPIREKLEDLEENKAEQEEVDQLKGDLTALKTGKQDKLIAGSGITIAEDGKTISSTGGSTEKKFALIELINLDEDVDVVERTMTPEGNPYNFDELYVQIKMGDTTRNDSYYLKAKYENVNYSPFARFNNFVKNAGSSAFLNNRGGIANGQYSNPNTDLTATGALYWYPNYNPRLISDTIKIPVGKITGLLFQYVYGGTGHPVPVGTRIYIFAR